MSVYSNNKITIMPKITQSLRIPNSSKKIAINENYYLGIKSEDSPEMKYKEKKPGSSAERKKEINIFPKIFTSKIPPPTANNPSSIIGENKNNNINDSKNKKEEKDDKDEIIENIRNNNKTKTIDINHINLPQIPIKMSKDFIEEKKLISNKTIDDINKYKDISINILINNNELNGMYEKLYKNDINARKKWVDLNLFGREVFKIRLETYIKNKMDITSFIKNEIQKILSNQYYDYIFEESYKHIQTQCDEHMKFIENIYN